MVNKEEFKGRDLISVNDLTIDEINYVINLAEEVSKNPVMYSNVLKGKMMSPLFFEPSTRTSTSFQAAMQHLGGRILDFDVITSSLKKGETLKDTVKMIDGYDPDIMIVRHKRDGSAKFVSDLTSIPVINAGDGQNYHPTQTLLDLYSIKEILGKVDGVKIAIAGDLKYGRTVHSLALALSRYNNCEIKFISPETLKMPQIYLDKLREKYCSFSQHSLREFKEAIEDVDILYMTRVQRERFPEGLEGEEEYKKISEEYLLKKEILENVKPGFKVLHPLPKVFEIENDIDDSEYAYYYKQAKNGFYIRKALLLLILGGEY